MVDLANFHINEISGRPIDFSQLTGKVVIVVNTASKCGLAPQLEGLEALYQRYHADGLEVIGFPSNQFQQELADESDIEAYCQLHYGVTFPITEMIYVNGPETNPLFATLKSQSHAGMIKWNFTKFLIGKDGQLIKRYAPITKPEKMEGRIVEALKK